MPAIMPKVLIVSCKRCDAHIPAHQHTPPRDNIAVSCPICGEIRRYVPNEVYEGFPDYRLAR